MIGSVLQQAWAAYRGNFGMVAAVVVVVRLPLVLLSSYMDYFVFEEGDLTRSLRLSHWLESFIGIIATAGVISIGYTAHHGQPWSFRRAMSVGGRSWGRMWWTRFITGCSLIIGFVLLVVPGLFLLVRLGLVESVAVCERVSGSVAMRRSYELTRGRFWQIAGLGGISAALMVGAPLLMIVPTLLFPGFDHWLIDAGGSLLAEVITVFATLIGVSAYTYLSAGQETVEPVAEVDRGPADPV